MFRQRAAYACRAFTSPYGSHFLFKGVRMMDFTNYRYPSRREVVFGRNGMVCSTQPLASQAGVDVLKRGGNAVDAAVAAAACMTVLEPTSNGIGSDAFALVWIEKEKKLYGLNASGRAPMDLHAGTVRDLGFARMPQRGWIPVMVPGAPSGWTELTKRFGALSLREVMNPAIRYARDGYPVSPTAARLWAESYEIFSGMEDACFKPWKALFAPKGRAPRAGELWHSEDFARTLEQIADTGAEAFYRGELADRMDAFSRETGGYIRKSDLESYWCQWVEPIHVNYRGCDVWEIPPNGDGIIALMALNILSGFAFDENARDSEETFHRQLEAMKLAFADGNRYVADPAAMEVTTDSLLAESYAAERRSLIGEEAREPEAGDPQSGGTVYLCAADGEGNMVSYIQSNYNGFGSGVVIPGTGISLQNRGANFSLDEESPNCLAPGKKSFHTIIPGFLTKDGEAVGPFGVMGAFMQPQGHVQVIMNLLDFGCNPQEALDAPRWQWIKDKEVLLEPSASDETVEALRARGHQSTRAGDSISFGRGQMILRLEDGVLCGAAEPRAGGTAAAW